MKNKFRKATVCMILSIIVVFSTLIPGFAQQTSADTNQKGSDNFTDFSQLICISKYGNKRDYPENSIEGILSAAEMGADRVMVSVKKTSDGTLVLMTDENLSRMCVDASGNPVEKKVSDVGLYELATFHLRNGSGLLHEEVTDYTVPTLQDVINSIVGKTKLVIEDGWEYRDDIYKLLVDSKALDSAIIIADGGKKEISQWLSGKSLMPYVISKYTGNVVWNSSAFIKRTTSAGVVGVLLGDNTSHSTSFTPSTVKKLESKARAVIDMTNPKLCGGRTDTTLGWSEITSRGFSAIITNNVEEFNEYKKSVQRQRDRLNKLITDASGVNPTMCSTKSANKLKDTITAAKEVSAKSLSAMELENTYNTLYETYESLTDRTANDKDGTTITKGRVAAAICVILGLVVMELGFEYFRKKKIAERKRGKNIKKSKSNRDLN